MFRFFKRKPPGREIYFHEDDYCQQQLLPREATAYAAAEVKRIAAFADAHRVPGGLGWTDVYVRKDAPAEIRALKIKKEDIAAGISPFLPAFDFVYTGYGSYREPCKRTASWGRSQRCAVFADWNDDGIITNIWAEFSGSDKDSILAATMAVAALGKIHPLVYVDWAWGYTCDASDEESFTSMLRTKLQTIAENIRKT